MSKVRHSLRFKLTLTFAMFGAFISLLLSLGLSFTAHNLGERLIDETLRAELEDYMSRRMRNPASLPPHTLSIRGYVLHEGQEDADLPVELHGLQEGQYQLVIEQIPYRVAVRESGGVRFFMLFNEIRQRHREEAFRLYLLIGASIMVLLSATLGWLLAGRVVSPVAELARRVSAAHPEDAGESVSHGFAADEIGQLAGVFDDYLKRMRAFIEREQNFTADVSHELRTPLAIVQGVVEILQEDEQCQGRQRERMDRIGRANQDMINLTAALLLMAREEASGEEVRQTCDVCELATAVVESHRHLLSPLTQVELVCTDHLLIPAERTLLSIVVANLVRNAFIHTPSGSVTVSVKDRQLIVRDTGTGIRGEEMGKVFQRHFKGSGSAGSGIGLSLVKRICDRYGWETILESTEGEGTTAYLIFHAAV